MRHKEALKADRALSVLSIDNYMRTFGRLRGLRFMTNANLAALDVPDLLVAKATEHFPLSAADQSSLGALPFRIKAVTTGQDIVRQGDRPAVAVCVLKGMLARYHILPNGDRQYLSFQITGDFPDVQSLFLKVMDHSVCGIGQAVLALVPHEPLIKLVQRRPPICIALWRLTLADAAIFRQAITNTSRTHVARLAHLFCEQYFRAKRIGLADGNSCHFPVSQVQIGQALGMSHISINRALQRLRKLRLVDFRAGVLTIIDWPRLVESAGFDPLYLYAAE
jgi:CRP-like cAMP-binding protein